MTTFASQLGIYQGALRLLGERKLASLIEAREPRYLLDDVYNDGGINFCLEQASWNFAIRPQLFNGTLVATTNGVGPPPSSPVVVGFRYQFTKPADWRRTASICSDPYFRAPLTALQYTDQSGLWTSDLQQIYVRYVSDDPAFGLSYALWGESFYKFVQHYFAMSIADKLTGTDEKIVETIEKKTEKALVNARSKDALQEGEQFPPIGIWAGSRSGRATRRDRGSIQSLYG